MYVVLCELRREGNIEYSIKYMFLQTDHAEVVENWVFARAVDINSLVQISHRFTRKMYRPLSKY